MNIDIQDRDAKTTFQHAQIEYNEEKTTLWLVCTMDKKMNI